ncbi:hypothetical protein [uncultured Shimia sp.]|uniref:hypothetical protein n=1 Tax=uncultured Shimia sp. TaxID=573152 RepID=UPI002600C8CA|nr:hypothetical protein [uncultured Shimia sp.]
MTQKYFRLDTLSKSVPLFTGRIWRAPVLLLMGLSLSGCTAAVIGSGMADPFYDAIDKQADKQVQEQYRQKYPGVDVTDDYALGRAMFEEAKRENPEQLGDMQFPSRSVWEANYAKVSGGTAAATATASGAATTTKAATTAPGVSSNQRAQDQAMLKKSSTPWAVVTKSWPYDALNFSSVAPYACGVSRLQYSVNGGPMKTQGFTPCSAGASAPNPPYITFPQGSIETVKITMTLADGSQTTRSYQRDEIFQR